MFGREQVTMLDRWSVSAMTTSKGGFRKGQKDRQLIMNNYLGIGVDGQVALDFHKVRPACPLFASFAVLDPSPWWALRCAPMVDVFFVVRGLIPPLLLRSYPPDAFAWNAAVTAA